VRFNSKISRSQVYFQKIKLPQYHTINMLKLALLTLS